MNRLPLGKFYKKIDGLNVIERTKLFYLTIKKRGFIRTLKTLYKFDAAFDLRYGTDTWHWVSLEDLEIESKNKERGILYGGTPSRHLMKILKTESFPDGSTFVDVGSGKGRVLMVASKFNFKKIVGIEFSSELCDIAIKNISIYKTKAKGITSDIEVIHGDVLNYDIKKDDNIFFMYNPFDEVILKKFLDNIDQSLIKYPRKIWLIYYNPVHKNVVENKSYITHKRQYLFNDVVDSSVKIECLMYTIE